MKQWFNIHRILIAVAVLCIGVSCSDNSCYDNGSAIPLVRFYASGSTKQVTLINVSIKGLGAPGDSVLVNNESVNEVYLPLRANANSTKWVFDYNSETLLPDTLTIDYSPVPYFASVECGAMYNFKVSEVTATHHAIDSVKVEKPLIDNVADVALRLFFKAEL